MVRMMAVSPLAGLKQSMPTNKLTEKKKKTTVEKILIELIKLLLRDFLQIIKKKLKARNKNLTYIFIFILFTEHQ